METLPVLKEYQKQLVLTRHHYLTFNTHTLLIMYYPMNTIKHNFITRNSL